MRHPLLTLAGRERLNSDPLERALNPAKVANVRAKAKSYKLADGGGLFLLVLPKGNGRKPSCLWRYKYRINGREGLYAIGPLSEIGLADARQIHRAARWLVQRGIHPAHYVREELERQDTELRRKQANTLRAISEQWVARDAKRLALTSLAQRRRELDNDVLPTLGHKPIGEIRKEELSALLERIQKRAPEVARNVRQHLSGVFGYAMDAGLVTGTPVPGPKVLQARKQTAHPALSLDKVHGFLADLDAAGCNGPGDAYRHCLASCMMTRENSEAEATVLGWLNEKRGDWTHNQERGERQMDDHNNAVGRMCGKAAKSTQDCVDSCVREVLIKSYQQGSTPGYWY